MPTLRLLLDVSKIRILSDGNNRNTTISLEKHSYQEQNDGERRFGRPKVEEYSIKAHIHHECLLYVYLLNQNVSTPFLQERELKCVTDDLRLHDKFFYPPKELQASWYNRNFLS